MLRVRGLQGCEKKECKRSIAVEIFWICLRNEAFIPSKQSMMVTIYKMEFIAPQWSENPKSWPKYESVVGIT